MTPKKFPALNLWFVGIGCFCLLWSFLLRILVLFYIGLGLLFLTVPLQAIFWRCPCCKSPLPWPVPKGKHLYRCTKCGTEIEI